METDDEKSIVVLAAEREEAMGVWFPLSDAAKKARAAADDAAEVAEAARGTRDEDELEEEAEAAEAEAAEAEAEAAEAWAVYRAAEKVADAAYARARAARV